MSERGSNRGQLVEHEVELARLPRSARRRSVDVLEAHHDPADSRKLYVVMPQQGRGADSGWQVGELADLVAVGVTEWPTMQLVVRRGRRLDEDVAAPCSLNREANPGVKPVPTDSASTT